MHRRLFLQALAAAPVSTVPAWAADAPAPGLVLTELQRQAGAALLARAPSVDMHSHAGRFFVEEPPGGTALARRLGAPFGPTAARQASQAGLGAVWLSTVADYQLLDSSDIGLRSTRDFAAGEALEDHRRQVRQARETIEASGLVLALDAGAVRRARRRGKTACILAVEGGDFIEDRLERVDQAYDDGVRAITIIHYRTSLLGDPQTASPTHGGLTRLGRQVIGRMNRLGMVVDLTHASFDAVKHAVEASSKPMVLSHSNLAGPGATHPRLVSLEHARLVAEHGGVVAALPGGPGVTTLGEFVSMVLRMIDGLGVDHVGVGTDMDFSFRSVTPSYAHWGLIAAGLLANGLAADDAIKVLGGNALRILDAA